MIAAVRAASPRPCLVMLACLFLVLVASTIGPREWPFELLNHFVLQYLLGAGFLCLLFVLSRQKIAAAAALLLVLAFAADYRQAPQTVGDLAASPVGVAEASVAQDPGLPSHRFSLITFNMSVSNSRHQDVAAWLATRPADVIALEEVPSEMVGGIPALRDIYPHQFVIQPGTQMNSEVYVGNESLAVLSVYPIAAHGVVRPSGQGKLSLLAQISVPGAEDPWVVVVHPTNPATPARLTARDLYLLDLAELIAELEGPVVVAGDFNATPYAPTFSRFLSISQTSTPRDFPATWPSRLGALGIPIDHVLVRQARIADLQAYQSMGSDHRALKAEILLPVSAAQPDASDPL